MDYRSLSEFEILQLTAQGCYSDFWNGIQVKDPFDVRRFRNITLSGDVKLGAQNNKVLLPGGIEKECGIFNSTIHNCSIGSNVFISNVSALANYDIANDVIIENTGIISVTGKTSFGNGVEIDILNEAGGRTLKIFDQLSAQLAYMLVFYRHNSMLIEKLNKIIDEYSASRISNRGIIEQNVIITNTHKIMNVNIGANTQIDSSVSLEEGTIVSSSKAPVTIGTGVIARKFIVLSGSKIDQSAILENCFIGQSVKIGKQYSGENSAFFCNSELFHGEGCSLFAGPYTVTHHKSTLLIAGFFSFYNAGSGSNQSNHMYKLGPVHQGVMERGTKTGSFSYLLWPSRVGPFTNVIGKHYANFNTSDLPFSVISEHEGRSVCIPAMNIFTVGTKRDSMKWPARDGRKDSVKLDLIHFNLFSPYIIGKIIRGLVKLQGLADNSREGQDFLNFNGIAIQKLLVKTAGKYYEMAIKIFIGDCLIKKLNSLKGVNSLINLQSSLSEEVNFELERWLDINGLLTPESSITNFINRILIGEINHIPDFHSQMEIIHSNYDCEEWKWCAKLIELRFNLNMKNISPETLITIIDEWKINTLKFNNMILLDAMKEFNQDTKLNYGIDGDQEVCDADFETVRGSFEQNSFVKGVKVASTIIEENAKSAVSYILSLEF